MFGIGMPELILLFVLALLVFGPKKLPEIGKQIGRALGELRRASEDLKEGWAAEVAAVDDPPAQPAAGAPAAAEPPPAATPAPPETPPPDPEPTAGGERAPREA
ncbi:MAG: twin-arginine translocase TatA/TatE family subunit [candidate division NC10 bacterium]